MRWSVSCASLFLAALLGYEDVNEAERLRHDPAMRWIVGGRATHGSAASPSQVDRFETQWLATDTNLAGLIDLSGQWIELVHRRRPPRGIALDMDSSVSPTHGEQELIAGTAITNAPATTRCSYSTSSAIWNAVSCVLDHNSRGIASQLGNTSSIPAFRIPRHTTMLAPKGTGRRHATAPFHLVRWRCDGAAGDGLGTARGETRPGRTAFATLRNLGKADA